MTDNVKPECASFTYKYGLHPDEIKERMDAPKVLLLILFDKQGPRCQINSISKSCNNKSGVS